MRHDATVLPGSVPFLRRMGTHPSAHSYPAFPSLAAKTTSNNFAAVLAANIFDSCSIHLRKRVSDRTLSNNWAANFGGLCHDTVSWRLYHFYFFDNIRPVRGPVPIPRGCPAGGLGGSPHPTQAQAARASGPGTGREGPRALLETRVLRVFYNAGCPDRSPRMRRGGWGWHFSFSVPFSLFGGGRHGEG